MAGREQRTRLSVRLSTPMLMALELVAERNGLPPATQAMMLLRQALARTMESKEFAAAMETRGPRTRDQWAADQAVTAEVLRAEEAEVLRAAAEVALFGE